MKNFGLKIKMLRIKKGLNQAQLGKALGVSTSAIGMYERGKRVPTVEFVMKAGELFGVSTDFLLGRGDIPETVEDILVQVKNSLVYSSGLVYNGVPLGKTETRRLFDAMYVAANVILNQKLRDNEGKFEF